MEAKTYYAKSIDDAISQIQEDLGPDAAIVHTRKLPNTLWNLLKGRRFEVVASLDLEVPNRFQQWMGESSEDTLEEKLQVSTKKDTPQEFESSVDSSLRSDRLDAVSVDKKEVPSKEPIKEISPSWDPVQYWLTQLSQNETAAKRLTEDLVKSYSDSTRQVPSSTDFPGWDQIALQLGKQMSMGPSITDLLRVNHPQGKAVRVALVGPTGVGKTTTIAKLAGQYQKYDGLKVGLITVDTFRVGAIDQLHTYCQIMGLPLKVVSSESEIPGAEAALSGCDLILIDTVGRSPRDKGRIQSLQTVLSAMQVDHILLTLSSSSSCHSLKNSLNAFSMFQSIAPNSLAITKVDEVESLTGLWPFFADCDLPWSYWTNGQNVPDDIGEAKENVAVWFLDKIPLAEGSTLS